MGRKDEFKYWHGNFVSLNCDPSHTYLYGNVTDGNDTSFNALFSACKINKVALYNTRGELRSISYLWPTDGDLVFKEVGSFMISNAKPDPNVPRSKIDEIREGMTGYATCKIVEDYSTFRERKFEDYLSAMSLAVDKKEFSRGKLKDSDIDPMNADTLIRRLQEEIQDLHYRVSVYPDQYEEALKKMKELNEKYRSIKSPLPLIRTLKKHLDKENVTFDEWMEIFNRIKEGKASDEEEKKWGSGLNSDFNRMMEILKRVEEINEVKKEAFEIYHRYVIEPEGIEVLDHILEDIDKINDIRKKKTLVDNLSHDPIAVEFFEKEIYPEFKEIQQKHDLYLSDIVPVKAKSASSDDERADIYRHPDDYLTEEEKEAIKKHSDKYLMDEDYFKELEKLRKKWLPYEDPSTKYVQMGDIDLRPSGLIVIGIEDPLIRSQELPEPRVTYRVPKAWVDRVVPVCVNDEGNPTQCSEGVGVTYKMLSDIDNEKIDEKALKLNEAKLACVPEAIARNHTVRKVTVQGEVLYVEHLPMTRVPYPIMSKEVVLRAFNSGDVPTDSDIEKGYNLCHFKEKVPALHDLSKEQVEEKLGISKSLKELEEKYGESYLETGGEESEESEESEVVLFGKSFKPRDIKRGEIIDLPIAMRLYEGKSVIYKSTPSRGFYDDMDINWIASRIGTLCEVELDMKNYIRKNVSQPISVGTVEFAIDSIVSTINKIDGIDNIKTLMEDIETDYFSEYKYKDNAMMYFTEIAELSEKIKAIGDRMNVTEFEDLKKYFDHYTSSTTTKTEKSESKSGEGESGTKAESEKSEIKGNQIIAEFKGYTNYGCLNIDKKYIPDADGDVGECYSFVALKTIAGRMSKVDDKVCYDWVGKTESDYKAGNPEMEKWERSNTWKAMDSHPLDSYHITKRKTSPIYVYYNGERRTSIVFKKEHEEIFNELEKIKSKNQICLTESDYIDMNTFIENSGK